MNTKARRHRRRLRGVVPFALGALVATGVTQLLASRTFEVAKPSENIRANPEGRQIGTLLEGARIEEAGRDGKWVKFRLEAWIWGPSLEGYTTDRPSLVPATEPERSARSRDDDDDDDKAPRQPRTALSVHVEEVRTLIEETYGTFYGMRLDPDLSQVQVRFRVRKIEPEALLRRHMRVQHAVFEVLSGDVAFASLRIETNRADGSGEVGTQMSATDTTAIRLAGGEDLDLWLRSTRRSTDGGRTWTEAE